MQEQKTEKVFAQGLIFKEPRAGAPSFVKGSISIKSEEFKTFIDTHTNNGWLNIDLKIGQSGKAYAELNTWKPTEQGATAGNVTMPSTEVDVDLPF